MPCTQAGKLFFIYWGRILSDHCGDSLAVGREKFPSLRWEGILSTIGTGCPGWRWSSHLWKDLEQVDVALGDTGYCCLVTAGILKVFSNLNNSTRILWMLLPPQSKMSSALTPSPAQCIMQMSLPAPKTFQSHSQAWRGAVPALVGICREHQGCSQEQIPRGCLGRCALVTVPIHSNNKN